MQQYFADLHIHVGITENGQWIKIPTSRNLTVRRILEEAITRKGMSIVGIVDALSPMVLHDIKNLISEGLLQQVSGGGYCYKQKATFILGAEIETAEDDGRLAHTLIYLPDMESMASFSKHMSMFIRNINLSSQNAHMPLRKLVDIASGFDAAIIPAHAFTPHKSIYGACTQRLAHILPEQSMLKIAAIELGLSADTLLADRISELAGFTFITNSDAHSLDKIGREYNVITLADPNFEECIRAFLRKEGRGVSANYGLDPRLGKYHRTFCAACNHLFSREHMCMQVCPHCGSKKVIKGVFDRINEIADFSTPQHPGHRPPYFYQIPLEFIPGLGKKTLDKLISVFGTEMNVLHHATKEHIAKIVGDKIAEELIAARSGTAFITAGGGGVYGRLNKKVMDK